EEVGSRPLRPDSEVKSGARRPRAHARNSPRPGSVPPPTLRPDPAAAEHAHPPVGHTPWSLGASEWRAGAVTVAPRGAAPTPGAAGLVGRAA
ncbi:unnamed protein product, partial [Urochloa humidicola]